MANGSGGSGSPWGWFLGGCLVTIVALGLVVCGAGFMVLKWGQRIGREMKDPATRTERAKEILGTETIPGGYHSMVALTVPYVADIVVLTDRHPDEKGEITGFGSHGLIYLRSIRLGGNPQELEDYFTGKSDDAEVLRRNRINVGKGEVLERGILPDCAGAPQLLFLVKRGTVAMEEHVSEGLMSLALPKCPDGDGRQRIAIWFCPEPEGGDRTGSCGDPAAVREFMNHFRLCGPS